MTTITECPKDQEEEVDQEVNQESDAEDNNSEPDTPEADTGEQDTDNKKARAKATLMPRGNPMSKIKSGNQKQNSRADMTRQP